MNALMLRTPVFGGVLSAFDDELDSIMRSGWGWPSSKETTLPVDIEETDDGYNLSFDVPGVEKKDVSVEVKDGVVTVSGERRREEKGKKDGYAYKERSVGTFSRSFRLPEHVSENEVSAKLKDGILEVRLLKVPEAKPKRISID